MTPLVWTKVRRLVVTASFKNIRSLWTTGIAGLALGSISSLVLARQLGPAGYGYLGIVSAFGALVFAVLDPRAGDALTKFLGAASARGDSAECSGLVKAALVVDAATLVVGTAVAAALHAVVGATTGGATLDIVLATLGFGLFSPMATCRSALGVIDEFRVPARLGLAFSAVRSAGVVVVALYGLGVRPVLVVALLLGMAELLGLMLLMRQRYQRRWVGGLGVAGVRAISADTRSAALHFMRFNGMSTLMGAAVKYGDTVILGAVAGATATAFYRLALALTAPVAAVSSPLQSLVYNRLVQVRATVDIAAETRVLRRTSWLAAGLATSLLLAVPLMPFVIGLLAGDAYSRSVPAAQILLVGSAVGLAGLWLRPYFLASGRERPFFYVSAVTAPIAVVGFLIGAPHGAVGVATARVAVVSLLGTLVLYVLSRRLRPCKPKPPPTQTSSRVADSA